MSIFITNSNSNSSQLKSTKTDSTFFDNKNQNNKLISIYPNPTSGIVNIQCNNDLRFKIEITNILGENIYTSNFITNNIGINLTQYGKGIYFIKLDFVDIKNTLTKYNNYKLIKQ